MMVQETMGFRRGLNLRPINSQKHVIDVQAGIVANTNTAQTLIEAADNPVLANVTDVATAAVVRSFFLNVQVAATGTAALANIYFYIMKNPGNAIPFASFPDANAVGSSDVKKLIFHQEMIMTEKNTTAIARTMFRGVIKIPRHMQRMGQDDEIDIIFFAPGVNFDVCTQAIYKEFK